MIIGYDAKRAFTNRTGLGNYSRDLIDLVSEKDVKPILFSPVPHPDLNWNIPDRADIVSPKGRALLWRTYYMYQQALAYDLDLYHGLSHELPLSIKKISCPSLVTMHDLIYKRFPQYFGWWDRKVYDYKWKWAVHTADHIVAISQSTADDLIKFLNVPANNISVIYNCVSPDFKSEEEELASATQLPGMPDEDYVLFLGQHNERKNLDLVIKAYERAASKLPPLVILGAKEQINWSDAVPADKIIQPMKRYSGTELATIVRQARVLVYPSRFEGFGLPILEAMQSGTPVISCHNSSLPEVGGDAILYTSEDNSEELIHLINRVAQEDKLYRDLRQAGLDRAQLFSRERHQTQMLELYRKLIP